jgi:uncharacterized protein (TIGR00255 family)
MGGARTPETASRSPSKLVRSIASRRKSSVNLPRDLEVLEAQIRDEINRRVSRGRVTVRVSVHTSGNAGPKTRMDLALAKSYVRDLRALGKSLGLENGITVDLLARLPGVVQPAEAIGEAEELWPATSAALNSALDLMLKMRAREGNLARQGFESRAWSPCAGASRASSAACPAWWNAIAPN